MEFISNFNGLELIFIIILAILLFGPEKIPEIASKLGSWIRTLRNLSSQVMDSLREETGLSEISEEGAAVGTALRDTADEMDSSARSLKQQVAGTGDPSSRTGANQDYTDQSQPAAGSTTRSERKAALENRLQILENELQQIRGELAQEDTEKAADSND